MPCLHRNGEITGYTVVATVNEEMIKSVNVDGDDGRETTISGLTPNTQYSVSVAAVNSADTGPASEAIVDTPGELCVAFVVAPKNLQ